MNRLVRAGALTLCFGVLAQGCAEGFFKADGSIDGTVDGTVDVDPVGAPCVYDADCPEAGMRCLKAYEPYAEPNVGMIVPRSYCTYSASCTVDADCGAGAGCWRPLEGVPEEELASLDFDPAPLVGFGQCLVACEDHGDCGEGFVCQKPLLRALAPLDSAPERPFCVFDDTPLCDDAVRTPGSGKCTVTYALEAEMWITDTPLGLGNIHTPIGPGTLVVEVPANTGQPATSGSARVKCFELDQRFSVTSPVPIDTAVRASFVSAGSATGTLSSGVLTFADCSYAATRGVSSTSWTYEDAASGPGCLTSYASRGGVYCDLGLCGTGGLMLGSNPQDEVWTQPFNALTFTGGFNAVAMGGAAQLLVDGTLVNSCSTSPCLAEQAVEIPNDKQSRTWMAFTGSLLADGVRCTP
jgi:hypothetical protein